MLDGLLVSFYKRLMINLIQLILKNTKFPAKIAIDLFSCLNPDLFLKSNAGKGSGSYKNGLIQQDRVDDFTITIKLVLLEQKKNSFLLFAYELCTHKFFFSNFYS